jgi:hypothetical protein
MRAACVLVCLIGLLFAGEAAANPIERACLLSPRAAADPAVCGCIGSAAQRTLTQRQMRAGARFFANPDHAQEVRQSDRPHHEALWQAWRAFGEAAESMCGQG